MLHCSLTNYMGPRARTRRICMSRLWARTSSQNAFVSYHVSSSSISFLSYPRLVLPPACYQIPILYLEIFNELSLHLPLRPLDAYTLGHCSGQLCSESVITELDTHDDPISPYSSHVQYSQSIRGILRIFLLSYRRILLAVYSLAYTLFQNLIEASSRNTKLAIIILGNEKNLSY